MSIPHQIADLKALKGDPSDNIPGVPGVGDKTALKLIQQFGSVEQLLNHLDEVEPAKLRDKLKENIELIKRSHELATIVRKLRSRWISINAASLTAMTAAGWRSFSGSWVSIACWPNYPAAAAVQSSSSEVAAGNLEVEAEHRHPQNSRYRAEISDRQYR